MENKNHFINDIMSEDDSEDEWSTQDLIQAVVEAAEVEAAEADDDDYEDDEWAHYIDEIKKNKIGSFQRN